jgi:YjbE family integral membrane protein
MSYSWDVALNAQFFADLGSIMLINLLLSGDNAVIIAMAVRGLRPEQRRMGIVLGAGAAIVMRIVLTFFVAQLLNVSYVKLVGGALILWIAVKLFIDGSAEEKEGGHSTSSIWGAVKVILIADATMSLDNMLAVAAACHGNLVLLTVGLVVSIFFVVFASDLLSKLMDRYPVIVWVGAAILGKVGAEMILTDPVVQNRFHPSHAAIYVAEAVMAVAVLVVGKLWSRRTAAVRGGTGAAEVEPG